MVHNGFSQVLVLALNVWRESVRDKALHILAVSGIVIMLFSQVLGNMAIGGPNRIIHNMGLWVLGIWGLCAVVYLGSNVIRREIQQKTIYLLLSRPVSRFVFMSSKMLGISMVLATVYLLMVLVWLLLMVSNSIQLNIMHFWTLVFIFGEWLLIASIGLFLASFTSPLLYGFILIGLTFLGHWSESLRIYAQNTEEVWLRSIISGLYYILPNLEALNFRQASLYNEVVGKGLIFEGGMVLLLWWLLFFTAANVIFYNRKMF